MDSEIIKKYIGKVIKKPKNNPPKKGIKKRIIYRLKEARKLNGLTLREAASALEISFQYLDKIEKKGCYMDSEKLIKYANFYNVKIDYLIPNNNRPKVEFGKIKFFKFSKF